MGHIHTYYMAIIIIWHKDTFTSDVVHFDAVRILRSKQNV